MKWHVKNRTACHTTSLFCLDYNFKGPKTLIHSTYLYDILDNVSYIYFMIFFEGLMLIQTRPDDIANPLITIKFLWLAKSDFVFIYVVTIDVVLKFLLSLFYMKYFTIFSFHIWCFSFLFLIILQLNNSFHMWTHYLFSRRQKK